MRIRSEGSGGSTPSQSQPDHDAEPHRQSGPPRHLPRGEAGEGGEVLWDWGGLGGVHTLMAGGMSQVVGYFSLMM